MVKQVTDGVRITVETCYEERYSDVDSGNFVFTYKITIENTNDFPVQLLSRHWDIFDSNGELTTVDGEGVVGKQPVLHPGEYYNYESACNLKTTIGRMSGYYNMVRVPDNKKLRVEIPEFELMVPFMLN
jgi:ApaG protein